MITRQPRWSDKPLYYRATRKHYLMLKALKRWYFHSLAAAWRYVRWARKSKYRYKKPAEIEFYNEFVHAHTYAGGGFVVYQVANTRKFILSYFNLARMPAEYPVDELDKNTTDKIEKLYNDVLRWRLENGYELDSFLGSVWSEPHISQE